MISKSIATAAAAVADVPEGASICVGGFGLCGNPMALIKALHERGVGGLKIVSNNCGADGWGLAILLADHRIVRLTSSYVGDNKEFERQYLEGEIEVELTPQGTLAERMRAGGMGIPAFYTPAGVGTPVADGGLPWRYGPDGSVRQPSPRKETREFDGKTYVLERAIRTDFAFVHAARGDTAGNLVFHESAANFNPVCAMAGRITIAEVEELVEVGAIGPDQVHLPGIFVQRIVAVGQQFPKRIERRTVRRRAPGACK